MINVYKKQITADRVDLSVIIPAYNEQLRLPQTLSALEDCIDTSGVEIIIVCDGCTDDTASVAAQSAGKLPIRTISYSKNRGKGYAVRKGVEAACGNIIAFIDADGSTNPRELARLLVPIKEGKADIVIGSRRINGTAAKKQPFHRHIMGGVLSLLTRTVLMLPYLDTQCGCKLFSRASAKYLFKQSTCNGFEFDLDILYRAHSQKLRVVEVGINWSDKAGSKVNPLRDGLQMLGVIFRIRMAHHFRVNTQNLYTVQE